MPSNANNAAPTAEELYARDDEIDLIELGAGLWAKRWLIAAITLGISALATLYALLATPTYEASAELRPQTASALADIAQSDLVVATPQAAFARALSEMQSNAIQQRAIESALGDETSANAAGIFTIEAATKEPTRATVTARHTTAETAAALANTLVRLASETAAAGLIEELRSTAAARLANLERDMDRRREVAKRETDVRIAQLEEADTIARERLQDRIRALRTTARKLRGDELTRLREGLSIARELDITEPRVNEFQNIVNIDTTDRSLRSDRSANTPLYALGTRWLQAEIAALEARESDDHDVPEIRELEQQLAELEVNQAIQVLKARQDFTPFIPDIGELLTEKSRLEPAMHSEFPNLSVVRIDRMAQSPASPVSPRRGLIIGLGLLLGGMIGVFVALIVNAVQARRTPASGPDGS